VILAFYGMIEEDEFYTAHRARDFRIVDDLIVGATGTGDSLESLEVWNVWSSCTPLDIIVVIKG